MDDYNVNVLSEAKNEYSSRLITILSPLVLEGIKSIFNDAYQLCLDNEEEEKYLMTFQNFLSRVPKWNATIIETETQRIIAKSKCNYLEDLLTCVHITQLKILTSIRVSQKQKKVNIEIPKLQDFIHKCYTLLARKLYTNVYLYEKDVMPLTFQKNMRECEIVCRECIFEVIRDGIPIETILRAYIDETVDEEIIEEEVEKLVDPNDNVLLDHTKKNEEKEEIKKSEETVELTDDKDKNTDDNNNNNNNNNKEESENKEQEAIAREATIESKTKETNEDKDNQILGDVVNNVKETKKIADKSLEINIETVSNNDKVPSPNLIKDKTIEGFSNNKDTDNELGRLSFNNNDSVLDMGTNLSKEINAPKDVDRLEKISAERHEQRKLEESEYDDDDDDDDEYEKISIMGDTELKLDSMDIHDLNTKLSLKPDPILNDIEVLT